jgi:hypothetical protein
MLVSVYERPDLTYRKDENPLPLWKNIHQQFVEKHQLSGGSNDVFSIDVRIRLDVGEEIGAVG